MESILTWLFEQVSVIIVMGLVIWWLQKRLIKSEEQKDSLSKDVIRLTTLWETKVTSINKEDSDLKTKILILLNAINEKIKDT